jgi:hypothetical protein
MQRTSLSRVVLSLSIVTAVAPAVAQKTGNGINGKHACALLSPAEIQQLTGRKDVARTTEKPEESQFSSNCQFWGAFDITLHIGNQTKVMFGRERDTYAKAPAKLGYKIERISGLGDDAYYMTYNGKLEVRAMLGEIELAVSLSGKLPPDAEAKKMAFSLAKAAAAKMK